jgi:hypothetical protein
MRVMVKFFPGKSCLNAKLRSTAMDVAIDAAKKPTPRLFMKAKIKRGLLNTTSYHRKLKPSIGKPIISELLKERTIIIMRGP